MKFGNTLFVSLLTFLGCLGHANAEELCFKRGAIYKCGEHLIRFDHKAICSSYIRTYDLGNKTQEVYVNTGEYSGISWDDGYHFTFYKFTLNANALSEIEVSYRKNELGSKYSCSEIEEREFERLFKEASFREGY